MAYNNGSRIYSITGAVHIAVTDSECSPAKVLSWGLCLNFFVDSVDLGEVNVPGVVTEHRAVKAGLRRWHDLPF